LITGELSSGRARKSAGVPRRAQVGVERGVAVTAAEAAQPGERVGEARRADPRVRDVAAAERQAVRRVRGRADGRRGEERRGGGGVARQRRDEAGQVGGERAAGREVARGTVARVLRVRGGAGHERERQGGGHEDEEEAGERAHVELARPALHWLRTNARQEMIDEWQCPFDAYQVPSQKGLVEGGWVDGSIQHDIIEFVLPSLICSPRASEVDS